MVGVKIYVEGGGETNALRTRCRKGFSDYIKKAGFEGRMPRIVACGSRGDAFKDFQTAMRHANTNEFPVLLVDSEAPLISDSGPWAHLKERDNWDRPAGATDDHAHLMVQCMEAWFLADKQTLIDFFGQGFNENTLPQNPNIEAIDKEQIYRSLKNASRLTRTKGCYEKGDHSFEILSHLNPNLVKAASPSAKRFFDTLENV